MRLWVSGEIRLLRCLCVFCCGHFPHLCGAAGISALLFSVIRFNDRIRDKTRAGPSASIENQLCCQNLDVCLYVYFLAFPFSRFHLRFEEKKKKKKKQKKKANALKFAECLFNHIFWSDFQKPFIQFSSVAFTFLTSISYNSVINKINTAREAAMNSFFFFWEISHRSLSGTRRELWEFHIKPFHASTSTSAPENNK